MTSQARRAAAEFLRTIARSVDPSSESDRALMYAKSVQGTPQFWARSPDFARQVSGIECNIWDRPLAPSIYDDEFESTTIDPSWTLTNNAGTGTWSAGSINPYAGFVGGNCRYELHTNRRPSWIMIQPPNDTTLYEMRKSIAPASQAPFFIYARASYQAYWDSLSSNESMQTLQISTDPWDNNNRIFVQVGVSAANQLSARFFRVIGGVSGQVGITENEYITDSGMQAIDTVGITARFFGGSYNFDGWAFGASGHAIWLGTIDLAITPGMVSLSSISNVIANPGNRIGGWDFFRYRDGSAWLP